MPPIERTPSRPLPDHYEPPHSRPVRVGNDETWETVAAQYHMDVKRLVYFNFHTNNTDEVNWYLRRRVGCNVPSPSGFNWTFKNASPGYIHVPIKVMTIDDEGSIEGSPGVDDNWEDPAEVFSHHGMHLLHKILEGIEGAEAVAVIFELGLPHLLELGLTLAAPLAAEIGVFIAIGLGHADAIDRVKREQALWGLSYGIPLGADNRKGSFIRKYNFHRQPFHSDAYREQEGNFELAYQKFLAVGVAYGRKMNTRQKAALRRILQSHMDMANYPSVWDPTWPERAQKSYYQDAAIAFRKFILEM